MTSLVNVVLVVGAVVCCYRVWGSPLTGNKDKTIRDVEPAPPLPPLQVCSLMVMDMGILLSEGENYTHRCDFYECVNGQLESDIHECDNDLSDWDYSLCLQWSSDGCCCEVIGCQDVHGVVHDKDEWYQSSLSSNPDRPECGTFCQCTAPYGVCRFDSTCIEPVAVVPDPPEVAAPPAE